MNTFYSNGKLLISGEYLVLDGAIALAVPSKYGQSLSIEHNTESKLFWQSFDENGSLWFEDVLRLDDLKSVASHSQNEISKRLTEILNAARKLNPKFLSDHNGIKATTRIDFPRAWGLGTSSTLIHTISQWAKVNPYQLLEQTFGGSGYDIACASNNTPITYQIKSDERLVTEVNFTPNFRDSLYFAYLNKKQNSRTAIQDYRTNNSNHSEAVSIINALTHNMIQCKTLDDFELLINRHEQVISNIIGQKPIKTSLFDDFEGSIKSLGAWGGDFVLVTSKENPQAYFKSKGYETLIPFKDMVL